MGEVGGGEEVVVSEGNPRHSLLCKPSSAYNLGHTGHLQNLCTCVPVCTSYIPRQSLAVPELRMPAGDSPHALDSLTGEYTVKPCHLAGGSPTFRDLTTFRTWFCMYKTNDMITKICPYKNEAYLSIISLGTHRPLSGPRTHSKFL